MKDIDFDELDRAVSSLMKTVPEGAAPPPIDTMRVVNLGGSSAEVTTRSQAENDIVTTAAPEVPLLESEDELTRVQEVEAAVEQEAPASAPLPVSAPLSVVQRGRFMDVVRPSGRATRKPFPASAVSRQGVTLQPSRMSRPAEIVMDAEDAPNQDAPVSQSEEKTFAESYESLTQNLTRDTVEDSSPVQEESFFETEFMDESAPLSSPFLPDTKVEKRPLGRPIESAPAIDLAAELAESENEAVEGRVEATVDPVDPMSFDKDAQLPEQPLPAELGRELLSIETSTDNLPQDPQPLARPNVVQPTYARETEPMPVSRQAAARAMTAASIPQQYKVQPTQNETEPTGAIYDTQPLAHPAKGKPGWLWVVAIVAIILIGAGGGAALYYLGLL